MIRVTVAFNTGSGTEWIPLWIRPNTPEHRRDLIELMASYKKNGYRYAMRLETL